MCHTDFPSGAVTPQVTRAELSVELTSGEEMPAMWVTAAETTRAVLVIADMYGPSPFYGHVAALLAERGYGVLLPDYFFRQGPLAETSPQAAFGRRCGLDEVKSVADMNTLVDWLKLHHGLDRVGVVGFCMGGTFALDLASTRSDLVTVSYYGFPVPQASVKQPPPRPLDLVDTLAGPVLAFWGDGDEVVGIDKVNAYVQRAQAVSESFEHQIVPGVGHGFLSGAKLDSPFDPGGATWHRTLDHFDTYLAYASASTDLDEPKEQR